MLHARRMFRLDDYFPFLVHRVTAQFAEGFHAAVDVPGMTIEKWRVMASLLQQDKQNVGQLAQSTALEVSRLSHTLKRMEQEDLVKRRPDTRDGRLVVVTFTSRGKALARTILPAVLKLESAALDSLTPDERDRLKHLLHRVQANLGAFTAGSLRIVGGKAARGTRRPPHA